MYVSDNIDRVLKKLWDFTIKTHDLAKFKIFT